MADRGVLLVLELWDFSWWVVEVVDWLLRSLPTPGPGIHTLERTRRDFELSEKTARTSQN